jgi:hypothetical protein
MSLVVQVVQDTAVDMPVRIAAAVNFKNVIKTSWVRPRNGALCVFHLFLWDIGTTIFVPFVALNTCAQ